MKRNAIIALIVFVTVPSYLQLLAGSILIYNFAGPLVSSIFGICGMVTILANLFIIKGLLNVKKTSVQDL